MTSLPGSADENARQDDLDELHALDVVPEPEFSAIAELAAYVCRAPIGLVNLLGRDGQRFKGHHGVDASDVQGRVPFCTHVGRDLLEVPDTLDDERFRDESIVVRDPHVRFYAGAPVVSDHDHVLGTVCVMDPHPRRLSDEQRRALTTLAGNAAGLLKLHHYALQADQVLRRLQEVGELKNAFLRTVNHELRTPLTSIRSYLQLVQDGGLDEVTEQKFLRVIERNSDRILELIDELLLMASLNARTAPFLPDRVDLAVLAHRAVGQVIDRARAGRLTVTLHTPQPVMACADAGRVQHALVQLLDNAIKFTPPGGRIEVAAWNVPDPTVEVCDTGMGIAPADIEHVFDDFYRAGEAEERAIGGTGIGLSITRKIVELHDGTVQIDSRPEEGTRVRLILPAPLPCP
ncbi:GAF domain-containing sensor histidine kinase [Planomonospora sp. ID82291]|uniref:GAF domain-containing sensor histidine kinase n=1 Tax=Planomonospora sp. ID82291 TaxID=2738136 RepID=UPI0018C3A144|nr:GAF domain-containing sensor histidine kinase [Planomonospora sp. ID82291]MBG0818527.1 GAF domain-containing sensor histidine kinase [Planomonospora sp. ID82291]